jgi:hypothetical protein
MALLFKAVSWHAGFRSNCFVSFSCLPCMLKSRKVSWSEKPHFSDKQNIFIFFTVAFRPLFRVMASLYGPLRSHSDTPHCRSALDEWPARRRDLHLTARDTYERQTSMPPARFKPAIPESERPQSHASDRASTEVVTHSICAYIYIHIHWRMTSVIKIMLCTTE